MHCYKVASPLFVAVLLSACTSSGYRDIHVSDDSQIFNNIEVSKDINKRFRVQLESSIAKSKGSSVSNSVASPDDKPGKTVMMLDGIYKYVHFLNEDKLSVGDFEYAASKISYNYSVSHKTISGSYDLIHREYFGLRLGFGLSQYDYSVKALMHGDVDSYKFVQPATPILVEKEEGSSVVLSQYSGYRTPQGKVTNKQLNFDFTDYGVYVAVEPHIQFNKHYGASVRVASSLGDDSTIGTNVNSEISIRLNYKPVDPLEIYFGYQYFSLGKDLRKDNDTPSSSGHGESHLTIDTRGLLAGIAVRL